MCTLMVCDYLNQINCLFFSLNHLNYMIGLSAIAHKFAGELLLVIISIKGH